MPVKEIAYPVEAIHEVQLHGSSPATPAHEVQWLCWKARSVAGDILEVGTHYGNTTRELAIHCPNKIVYSIDFITDAPTMHPSQQREMPTAETVGIRARGLPNVQLLLHDSKTFYYGALDIGLVFIDGDHTYEGVQGDTVMALDYFNGRRKPLTIVWHDYYDHAWVSVKKFLTEKMGEYDLRSIKGTHLVYTDLA